MRGGSLLVSVMFLVTCAGCSLYSERAMYEIARDAVQKDSRFPLNARVGPAKDAEFYVGKSAARIEVPYEFSDSSGTRQRDTYTVWLKRICVRWEVDRCFPASKSPDRRQPGT